MCLSSLSSTFWWLLTQETWPSFCCIYFFIPILSSSISYLLHSITHAGIFILFSYCFLFYGALKKNVWSPLDTYVTEASKLFPEPPCVAFCFNHWKKHSFSFKNFPDRLLYFFILFFFFEIVQTLFWKSLILHSLLNNDMQTVQTKDELTEFYIQGWQFDSQLKCLLYPTCKLLDFIVLYKEMLQFLLLSVFDYCALPTYAELFRIWSYFAHESKWLTIIHTSALIWFF